MNTIQNPSVPFNLPIPGGMCLKKMVTLRGTVPTTSERFAVNLLCNSGDVALHICPKFRQNYVARNNVHNMNWGPEEKSGTLPIYPGQNFELMILCEQYDFKIAFNGQHFTEFNHRVPFLSISNLAVDGDVIVHNVYFTEPNSYENNNNPTSPPAYGFHTGPPAPHLNPGGIPPSGTPYSSNYNPNSYPTSRQQYSQGPSPYPQQPNYGHVPHQGLYPQVPSSETPAPNSKPSFLDQAGNALAGVLGPGLAAKGRPQGAPDYLGQAVDALAGMFGNSGRSDTTKFDKDVQPQLKPSGSGLFDQASTALAGILGGSGLGGATNYRGEVPPQASRNQGNRGFMDQAGLALAGILGGAALAKATGGEKEQSKNQTTSGFMDQASSALAGILGGPGLAGSNHHNRSVVGGALGTAIAGAALTGHLNPIKALKKQKKMQKKALKYGIPLAGVGLGTYALHKGLKKGFRRSSSSSSCSSSD